MKNEVIIDIALPVDFSICYVQAALIIGLQTMGNSRNFHEIAGTLTTAGQIRNAEEYLTALLKRVSEVKDQVIIDSQSNPQRSSTTPPEGSPGITFGDEGNSISGDGSGDINPLL